MPTDVWSSPPKASTPDPAPTPELARKVGPLLWLGILFAPGIFAWFTFRKGYLSIVRLTAFTWMIGVTVAAMSLGADDAASKKAGAIAPQAAAPPLTTTAADIASAYDANTVAADMRFKGKRFIVAGTIVSINTNLFGAPYVTLKGGVNPYMEPQFTFAESAAQAVSALAKGSFVRLACTGNGDVAKTPMSRDCVFAR
jgi:hypothetical protein